MDSKVPLITLNSLEETKNFAKHVSDRVEAGSVIALMGEMGSGKTTFTQFLLQSLGVSGRILSPTFTIVREYSLTRKAETAYHWDLYRLHSIEELEMIGFGEIISDKVGISIIEWPEIARSLLPNTTKVFTFNVITQGRRTVTEIEI